jgi:hypothetical protein
VIASQAQHHHDDADDDKEEHEKDGQHVRGQRSTTRARVDRRPLARKWWCRVNDRENWVPTVLQFPHAWYGAIEEHYRQASPSQRFEVYPFERVDTFLERFELPLFRRFRELAEQAGSTQA